MGSDTGKKERFSIQLAYIELEKALRQPGCPLCGLVRRVEHRYIANFLYESVLDVHVRTAVSAAWGFCEHHSWMLCKPEPGEFIDGMGTAIVYEDLLNRAANVLSEYYPIPEKASKGIFSFLTPTQPEAQDLLAEFASTAQCPACKHVARMKEIYTVEILSNIPNESFIAGLRSSSGFCLPHFLRILQEADSNEANTLINIQLEQIQNLRNEVNEYLRKCNYRFSAEPKGEEQNSPERAVEKIVGSRHLGTAWVREALAKKRT